MTKCLRKAVPFTMLLMSLFLVAKTTSAATKSAQETAVVTAPAPDLAGAPIGYPVKLKDRTLFSVHERIFSFSAEERAKSISERIRKLYIDPSFSDGLHVEDMETITEIAAGDLVIMALTDQDAEATGQTRQALAEQYAQTIRTTITELQAEYSKKSLIYASLWTLLATVVLFFLIYGMRIVFGNVYRKLADDKDSRIGELRVQKVTLLSTERIVALLTTSTKVIRIALTVLLLYVYVSLVFSFFPWTHGWTAILLEFILSPIRSFWQAVTSFLPNLFFIVVIGIVTYYTIQGMKFIFNEIEKGGIRPSGFYLDWAEPTFKICRFFILAFSAVVMFPYLPGSQSPAFQGVSVFLGILFSLGSTSAVGNVVAGVVLTYTRAFQIGDRVKIGDTVGDVMEKTLLVTRIRTIKNVEISVPNAMVLSSHIINYSTSAADQGLILHTNVTIGYDVPWRQVHELLIAAATQTSNILAEPKPFILQTSLDDFYVSYQLNAYTRQPAVMARTYSDLHQNIQDKFNEADVEIMSPHYGALRDGNQVTIPADYLEKGYEAPSFRVTAAVAKSGVPLDKPHPECRP